MLPCFNLHVHVYLDLHLDGQVIEFVTLQMFKPLNNSKPDYTVSSMLYGSNNDIDVIPGSTLADNIILSPLKRVTNFSGNCSLKST